MLRLRSIRAAVPNIMKILYVFASASRDCVEDVARTLLGTRARKLERPAQSWDFPLIPAVRRGDIENPGPSITRLRGVRHDGFSGESATTDKLSLPSLTAMVVGSMVGAGIFNLPGRFATATGPFGAIIAWLIAGTGMYMLARVFQALAEKRPDIDSGVFAYAKAGFGDYMGFLSAFGYWLGSCLGNVFYWVLIGSTLGRFFPDLFGDGSSITAIIVSLIGIWAFHFMILRGVEQATFINSVVTVAKIVPLIVAILAFVFFFNYSKFAENFFGGVGMPEKTLLAQVRDTMLITVFVFLGIEGASVYSRFAKKRSDVGKATILGFVGVTGLMVAVTLLPYATAPRAAIAGVQNPRLPAPSNSWSGTGERCSSPSACWSRCSAPISPGR